MGQSNKARLGSALMVGIFMLVAAGAFAQDASTADGEPALTMDEIIVHGERQDRTLLDTASSVGVITAADIEERSLQNLADILGQIANVTSDFNGRGFSIRGISNASVTGGGDGGLATIYVDGATISQFATSSGPNDTWDLQQVEVFRGAQSTNQGRNSLAGAIIIRSNDPVYETELKARLRLEEFDGFNGRAISAVLNVPLVDEQMAFRLSVDSKDFDGFIDNTTLNTDEFQKNESLLVRAKLLIEPASMPNLRNLITLSYTENDRGDDFVSGPDPLDRESTANILGVRKLDQIIATWEADLDLAGPWSVNNTLSFNNADFDDVRDDDRTSGGGINRRERVNDVDTLSEEFRLHYEGDTLNAFVGLYYFKEDEDNNRTIFTGINIPAALPPSLAPFGPLIAPFYADPFLLSSVDNNDRETRNVAGFFSVDWEASERVTLNAGLRYDREDKEFVGGRVVSLDSPLPDPAAAPAPFQPLIAGINGLLLMAEGSNPENLDTDYNAWLPQVGVVVHWSDDFTGTLQAKRAYRAGGASVSLIQGQIPFDPEFAWTYEAGVRYRFHDGRGWFSGTAFFIDWTDMQVLETIGADFLVSNAGEAEVSGFELELNARPNDQWNLFLNVGYSDTEFTSFTSQTGADLSGKEFPGASNWTLGGGAHWRGEMWFAQVDFNYRSGAPANVANTLSLDSRTVANAKVGFNKGNVSVYAYGRNIFDEEYITSINTANQATFGNVYRVGNPQIFGVEVSLNY